MTTKMEPCGCNPGALKQLGALLRTTRNFPQAAREVDIADASLHAHVMLTDVAALFIAGHNTAFALVPAIMFSAIQDVMELRITDDEARDVFIAMAAAGLKMLDRLGGTTIEVDE